MKTLQSNFTTPEQSKRLLELGVPADSADMMWWSDDNFTSGYYDLSVIHNNRVFSTERRLDNKGEVMKLDTLPCWSVGRLIEIHTICGGASSRYYIDAFPTNILNEVIWHLKEAVKHGWVKFSKLED